MIDISSGWALFLPTIRSPFILWQSNHHLVHLFNEFVNVLLTVSCVTTLSEASRFTDKSTKRGAQLEWPQESVHGLEVRARGVNFMYNVLDASNAKRGELSYEK